MSDTESGRPRRALEPFDDDDVNDDDLRGPFRQTGDRLLPAAVAADALTAGRMRENRDQPLPHTGVVLDHRDRDRSRAVASILAHNTTSSVTVVP